MADLIYNFGFDAGVDDSQGNGHSRLRAPVAQMDRAAVS